MAGSDTTARVLVITFVNILLQEPLLNRLRKELDPVIYKHSGALPESRQLESIALLKATIQEGLRIASTITNRGTLIARNEDLSCSGILIPRGVSHSSRLPTFEQSADISQPVPNLNVTERRPL